MANEIPFLILDAIRDKVAAIAALDLTVAETELFRARRPDAEEVSAPFAMIRPASEEIEEEWASNGDTYRMRAQVFMGAVAASGDRGDKDWPVAYAARMRHEIQKALLGDRTLGVTGVESIRPAGVVWFPEEFQGFDTSIRLDFDVAFTQTSDDSQSGF